MLLIIFAVIPQVFSYSQDEVLLIWYNSYTTLEAFKYSPGFSKGDTKNMSGLYSLAYYSTRANFTAGDVNGDGKDELIAVEETHTGVDIDILAYSPGYKIGNTVNLKSVGRAHHYSKTGEYIACDINGDSIDEILRIYPGIKGTIIEAYNYKVGSKEGDIENLHRVAGMEYYKFSKWLCGDIDGDGIDEIISLETATDGINLIVLKYSPGSVIGDIRNMGRISKLHYFDSEGIWNTGDIDGDGKDEIILASGREFRVFEFAPGYTFGSAKNLKPEFYMKYCCSYDTILFADLNEYLNIVEYQPEENLTVFPGETIYFSVTVNSSSKPEIVWYLNGVNASRAEEFTLHANKTGNYSITAVITDGKVTKNLLWIINVKKPNIEKIKEEKPKPVVKEENIQENLPPLLELISPLPGERISNVLRVRWKAVDPEGSSLNISISIDDKTFNIPNTGEFNLNITQMESGEHLLRVMASDGVNVVEKEVKFAIEKREVKPQKVHKIETQTQLKSPNLKYTRVLFFVLLAVVLIWIAYLIKISGIFEKKPREDLEEP